MIALLDKYPTISLQEMKKVKLMNRTDTKFVTTESRLRALLRLATDDYMLQSIDGEVIMPYYTRYYDTADCEMYRHHLHGKLTRNKVRLRRYVQSDVEFLEVKRKNNKGRTDKRRIPSDAELTADRRNGFLTEMSGYSDKDLMPQIENNFHRMTLVNKARTERLTIDMDLRFHNLTTGNDRDLSGLVIIELKRDGRVPSPIAAILQQLRIKPSGFSKYCIGMALTHPDLPANRFRPRLRMIDKLLSRQ